MRPPESGGMGSIRNMATGKGYDPGPQLPNYMKKQMKQEQRPASSAYAKTGRSSGARRTSSSVKNAQYSAARKPSAATDLRTQGTGGAKSAAKPSAAKTAASGGAKKRRKKDGLDGVIKALVAIAGVLLAVIVIAWLAGGGGGSGVSEDISDFLSSKKTFKEGVKLIGVDVSGLTAEEATGLVKNAAEKKLKTVSITVSAGEQSITLDYQALGMNYDIAKALEDGLAYGRGGDAVTDISASGAGEFDAEYTWSREAIEIALNNIGATINTQAVEPYAVPVTDWTSEERFTYMDGVSGQALNVTDTADQIETALRSLNFQTEIAAVTNAVLPTMTLDQVKAETQFIASFTTKFTAPRDDETKQNRKFNIQKAADIINGQAVQPGEQWSFNTVVGPRTYELGWKGANGISGGKEYTTQAGGGICQVSTTLYNALLCGNLEIIDRRAHSIPSDYVEKGLDATVDTSGIDFVWKNNTEYPIYVFVRVALVEGSSSRNTITVYIYGAPLPEGVTYKARSEIIETTERTDTIYTQDATIAVGYQKEMVLRHDGFVAEAYLDKYVNGELKESILLHTDKYKGNPAEIAIGIGPALDFGAVPPEDWQVYGTPPTVPGT